VSCVEEKADDQTGVYLHGYLYQWWVRVEGSGAGLVEYHIDKRTPKGVEDVWKHIGLYGGEDIILEVCWGRDGMHEEEIEMHPW
jgi:hypothetical protein